MKWVIGVGEVLTAHAVPETDKVPIAAPERCIKVFALTAVRNVKFHSGLPEIARSTVVSAWLREDRQEQKTAAEESIPEKAVREDRHRLQKMLISKFWVS
jgi:hypothetical protein